MLPRDKPCPGVLWGCGTSCMLSRMRCTYKVPLGIRSTEDVLIPTSIFKGYFLLPSELSVKEVLTEDSRTQPPRSFPFSRIR